MTQISIPLDQIKVSSTTSQVERRKHFDRKAFAELESKKHARGRALQYARRTLKRWQ